MQRIGQGKVGNTIGSVVVSNIFRYSLIPAKYSLDVRTAKTFDRKEATFNTFSCKTLFDEIEDTESVIV